MASKLTLLSTPLPSRQTILLLVTISFSLASCVAPVTTTGLSATGPKEKTTTTVEAGDEAEVKVVTSKVQTEKADTVIVNEVSFVYLILLALGWLLPSPNELGRWIRSIFSTRKKD